MNKILFALLALFALAAPVEAQVTITPSPVPVCTVSQTLIFNGTTWECGAAASGRPFGDADALMANSTVTSKLLRFSLANLTAATTRVITVPDCNMDLSVTTANYVLATGSAGAGCLGIRALVAADIPSIDGSKIIGSGSINANKIAAGTFGAGAYTFPGALAITGAFTGATTGTFSSTLAVTGALTGTTASFSVSSDFGIKLVPGTGTSYAMGKYTNTGGDGYVGVNGSTAGAFLSDGTAYAMTLRAPAGAPMEFGISSTKYMTLSTGGLLTVSGNSATYGLNGDGTNGLGIAATNASGAIRFYSGGSTLRWSINSAGALIGASGLGITLVGEAFNSDHTVPFVGANAGSDSGTTAVYNAAGRILKLSSSRRYKEHIATFTATSEQLSAFLALTPSWWDYIGKETGASGFISEDLADLPLVNAYGRSPFINYDLQGRPDSNRDYALIGMQHLILQQHDARLAALEAKLKEKQ